MTIEQMILFLIAVFLETVGLVRVILWGWKKLCGGKKLSGVLLLRIEPNDDSAEQQLRNAWAKRTEDPDWEPLLLWVICAGEGIGKEICQRYCAEKGIPLLETPQKAAEKLLEWNEERGVPIGDARTGTGEG